MTTPPLRILRASPAELDSALEILTEAARWEVDRGLESPWPIPFPAERVRPSLDRGDLYVAVDPDGRSLATVTLQWEDTPFWGNRPPDAGYIHRLAVRREFAGHGVGYAILGWAEGEVRRRGRAWLRLDTLTARARLHRYYQEFGFRSVGTVRVGGLDCTLFEKPVGDLGSDHPILGGDRRRR
jgi:GNAT superfamily N-acetyltransferase